MRSERVRGERTRTGEKKPEKIDGHTLVHRETHTCRHDFFADNKSAFRYA